MGRCEKKDTLKGDFGMKRSFGMKTVLMLMSLLTACCVLTAGCGEAEEPEPETEEEDMTSDGDEMIVGEDIAIEDITEFYFTRENINYDAYYQRYKFYVEDGKHMFFHETRERKDDYGPCTEEDTTLIGTIELTDDQWNEFADLVSKGTVKEREDSGDSGDDGPWIYLYWTNDEGKYQQFKFKSYKTEARFEEFCLSLVPEQASDSGDEAGGSADAAADDAIYQQFINDELKLDGETFSEIFSFVKEDFDTDPVTFYYDVDEDGKDELLVTTVFYGYNIYDVRNGELELRDCGDGTAAECGVYKGNGHVYVSHSDFSHAGRKMLSLVRYDGDGVILETIDINAEYWDAEDDMYDENSDFTYNGKKITMQEYEDYMNSYEFIDPDSENARPAP